MNKLAVIGNPVAHSRSPEIHTLFGHQTGIALSYEKVLAPLDDFAGIARGIVKDGVCGFNVTVPFKHDAFMLVDQKSATATATGAVNTVTVTGSGELHGDNTDGTGLVTDLTRNLGWQIEGSRVLLLGAGGAIAGILPALLAKHPARIEITNRTRSKADALAGKFDIEVVDVPVGSYDLVISGSSAGLTDAEVELPAAILAAHTCCYDMIYGSEATPFIKWAIDRGCARTSDGLGMLVEQAAAAFDRWFGVVPETEPVIAALRKTSGGKK